MKDQSITCGGLIHNGTRLSFSDLIRHVLITRVFEYAILYVKPLFLNLVPFGCFWVSLFRGLCC